MAFVKKYKATILRPDEEKEILTSILDKAKKGVKVLREDVTSQVIRYLKSDMRKNPFRAGIPGDKWFSLFRRRYNHRFKRELDPEMLRNVESAGFTEKVTNTVIYSSYKKKPVAIIKRADHMTRKTPPSWPSASQTTSTAYSVPTMPSPANSSSSCDSASENMADHSEDKPINFSVNARLEVMDFNEKWYPVKVVEVDFEEGEVLVHFEKWSDRYDEWLRMDSKRIRDPKPSNQSSSKRRFEKNEKVIAVWAYNDKYPATVRKVLPDGKYEVLFSDGYAKILRGCKLFKATEEDLKNWQVPEPKKPAPPMGADPLDPNLGPKEERRLKKRKLDVLESYLPHKKLRLDSSMSTSDSSPCSTSSPIKKEVTKQRGGPPLLEVKKEEAEDEDDDDNYDNYIDEGVEDREQEEPEPEESTSESDVPVPKQRRRRRGRGGHVNLSPWTRRKLEDEEDERWNVEIPPGASPVQIKEPEGYYRESLLVPDKKLPEGWTKHTMRRKNGVKWDVFLVNEQGRKFRSRNELRSYYADLNQPFPDDKFDFMVSRQIELTRNQAGPSRRKLPPGTSFSTKRIVQFRKKKNFGTSVGSVRPESVKRDPKSSGLEVKTERPSSPVTPAQKFSLSDFRSPDGGYTCCGKNFRKENLFQMHIKHYHPEFGMFGSTPNVADLAYARTVGEPLEDSFAELSSADRKNASDTLIMPLARANVEMEAPLVNPLIKEEPEKDPLAETVPEEQSTAAVDNVIQEEKDASLEMKEVEKSAPEESNAKEDTSDEVPSSPKEVSPEVSDEEREEPKKPVAPEPLPPTEPAPVPESTPKVPIMITKYNPPGHKSTVPLTKVTISMTSTTPAVASVTAPVEPKPTIKTLLPMRPPKEPTEPKDAPDTKPKEAELEEEPSTKSKPRKRTASESLPKKPKLMKPTTGSLEEQSVEKKEVPESPADGNTSYRFSRNRSQQSPLVSQEKVKMSSDASGRVVVEAAEDSTTGRRKFKRFKAANKINKKLKEVDSEPVTSESAPVSDEPATCENLRKEEIINCSCGYMEEDGLMIQCDLCLCWQHGLCNNIDKESEVPEKYVCSICQDPARQRASMKYLNNQDWLKEGKLPTLSVTSKNKESVCQRETMLKKSHDLTASLLQLQTVIQSLRVKTHIAQKADHPKLYLWAKSWKSSSSEANNENEDDKSKLVGGPTPEAAIDETECRLRLLEHVEDYQQQVDDRLTSIQAQIAALESEDPDLASEDVSQTLQMLMRDLGTVRQLAAVN